MKYTDEKDKCYGIAGMAIGIALWEGEDFLFSLDMDNEENKFITFTPDFYFETNPNISPKESWHNSLLRYQMAMGMMIANMMGRSVKAKGINGTKIKKALYKTIAEEGKSVCQLDENEIRSLYDETYSLTYRAFNSPRVIEMLDQIVEKLAENRTLSNYEIKELLGVIRE